MKWNVVTAVQTILSTELDSLASNGLVVSSTTSGNQTSGVYDNSTALDLLADFQLAIAYNVVTTAGTPVMELYLIPLVDGTNAATVDGSNQPQKALLVGSFESRLPSTSVLEYLDLPGVSIPPGKWKTVVKNTSGQALTSSSVPKSLKMRPYQTQ